MHFWRLNRKIARIRETDTANLRRSHPNRSRQQIADQAAALVRAEWVTVPKETPEQAGRLGRAGSGLRPS